MDLFTIVGACVRRWYVTLPVLALAIVGAYKAYESVAAEYSSSVSIAVLPAAPVPTPTPTPGAEKTPAPENPYAGSGGPRFAAAVLARNINTGTYRAQIGVTDRPDVTFTATASTQQPMIKIDATGPTAESVLDTLDRVTGQAGVVLNEFQTSAGAPQETLYRLAIAVPADTVTDITPSRWRNAGALIAVGLAAAATLATALDVALRRRRAARGGRRKAAANVTEPDETGELEDDKTPDEERAAADGAVAAERSHPAIPAPIVPDGAAAPERDVPVEVASRG